MIAPTTSYTPTREELLRLGQWCEDHYRGRFEVEEDGVRRAVRNVEMAAMMIVRRELKNGSET